MDIAKVGENSLKIKSKNTTFIINPEKKVDDEVVVLTSKAKDYSEYQDRVVIDGPGDYEVAGVSIHGEEFQGKLLFDFLEDSQKLLILPSTTVAKSRETEDYTATVVFLDEAVSESLPQINSPIVAVIGPDSFLPKDKSNIQKADKVSLKKTEESKGFIIHLSK
jgi:hypothetical protein